MTRSTAFKLLLLTVCVACTGCVHRIHVTPLPLAPSSTTITRSLQMIVGPLSLEGADHRPGITLLDWSHRDLTQGIVGYMQQRRTFASVSSDPADLTLRVATKLSLISRQGHYHYQVALQADMSEAAHLIQSYLVERTAVGSSVRWVTASDNDPIETALRLALDDLMERIEMDRTLYIDRTAQPAP